MRRSWRLELRARRGRSAQRLGRPLFTGLGEWLCGLVAGWGCGGVVGVVAGDVAVNSWSGDRVGIAIGVGWGRGPANFPERS